MPVDPDANLVSAMKACAFGLTHGRILLLFPEGERSIDGTVRYFKKGATILASELRVPIVPVAVKGAFEIWPRNRPFNWRTLRYWSRHRVGVVFGPPIELDQRADYAESSKRLRAAVEEMWNAL
jgi:1-acyl-sn-glycerol-3-phosphate acyltransferase